MPTHPHSDPSPPVDSASLLLGEVRGQLREVIHGMNNMSQKVDAISDKVVALGELPKTVADNKAGIAALQARVDTLEKDRDERRGAEGIVATILKSPLIGWLTGAAVAVWAYLKGAHS